MSEKTGRSQVDGPDQNRRAFLQGAGAGIGTIAVLPPALASDELNEGFIPFDEGTRFMVGDRGSEMVEMAYRFGHKFEDEHGGCARCTVAALQHAVDFVPRNPGLFRAATCLDGGAAPSGVQNCGGFTGAGIVLGYICGGAAFSRAGLAHKLLHKVAKEYKQAYGSVLCRDARKETGSDCPEVVGRAARWTAKVLVGQFTVPKAE